MSSAADSSVSAPDAQVRAQDDEEDLAALRTRLQKQERIIRTSVDPTEIEDALNRLRRDMTRLVTMPKGPGGAPPIGPGLFDGPQSPGAVAVSESVARTAVIVARHAHFEQSTVTSPVLLFLWGVMELATVFAFRGWDVPGVLQAFEAGLTHSANIYSPSHYPRAWFAALRSHVIATGDEEIREILSSHGVKAHDVTEVLEDYAYDYEQMDIRTSPLAASVLCHFIMVGGMRAFTRRCSHDAEVSPSPAGVAPLNPIVALHFLRALGHAIDMLVLKVIDNVLEEVVTGLQTRVLLMSDAELREVAKETFIGSLDAAHLLDSTLLKHRFPRTQRTSLDAVRLNIAMRCFRSQMLDKRLFGLSEISELIHAISIHDELIPNDFSQARLAPSRPFTSQELLKFLREQKVLVRLYRDNVHPELVKRAIAIPQFLARIKELTTADLELMWRSTEGEGTHESTIHAVYSCFESLVSSLSLDQLRWLFQRISGIPLDKYSKPLRTLLYQITKEGISQQQRDKQQLEYQRRYAGSQRRRAAQRRSAVQDFDDHSPHTSSPDSFEDESSEDDVAGILVDTGHEGNTELFAIPIWFTLLLDSTEAPPDVVSAACENLGQFLNWEACYPHRVPYLEKCLEKIRDHDSVGEMSALLLRIVQTYPVAGYAAVRPHEDRQLVIEWLQEEHDIVGIILDDLVFYKDAARVALAKNPHLIAIDEEKQACRDRGRYVPTLFNTERVDHETAIDSLAVIGRAPHLRAIRDRLDLLGVILGASPAILLDVDRMRKLWKAVVVDAFTSNERDAAFRWLQHFQGVDDVYTGRIFSRLSEAAAEDVFLNLIPDFVGNVIAFGDAQAMCSYNAAHFSEAGFTCFEYFFRYVNWSKGLFRQDAAFPNKFVVKTLELLGVNTLWKIALTSESDAVGKCAVDLMMNIQRGLAPELRPQMTQQRELLVATCFKHLAHGWNEFLSSHAALTQERAALKTWLERCVRVLEAFLAEYEPTSSVDVLDTSSAGPLPTEGTPLTVQVQMVKSGSKPEFTIPSEGSNIILTSQATIGHLQDLVADYCRQNCGLQATGAVRLITQGRELKNRSETLEDARVTNATKVHVVSRPAETSSAARSGLNEERPSADDATPPSRLISAQQYFDQLFALLDVDFLADRVWTLLMKLPLNQVLYDKLVQMDSSDWSSVIDTRSPLTLLYSLQIIDTLLTDARHLAQLYDKYQRGELDSDERAAFEQRFESDAVLFGWHDRFISSGGLHFLLRIFEGRESMLFQVAPDEVVSRMRREAQSRLILVLNSFLVSPPSAEKGKSEVQKLVGHRLSDPGLLDKLQAPVDTLVERLLQVMEVVARPVSEESRELSAGEESVTFTACAQLAIACCVFSPTAFFRLCDHESVRLLDTWVHTVLLESPHTAVRSCAAQFIQALCMDPGTRERAIPTFIQILLGHLNSLCNFDPSHSVEFLELMVWLASLDAGMDEEVFRGQATLIVSFLAKHSSRETHGSRTVDTLLVGMLQYGHALIMRGALSEEVDTVAVDLANELFQRCLFDIPSEVNHGPGAPPMCKTSTARKAAFDFLLELCRWCIARAKNPIIEDIAHRLLDLLPAEHRDAWSFDPEFSEKSPTGFVGLSNLGATCYMNSTLQQFFSIEPFRKELLAISPSEIRSIVQASQDSSQGHETGDKSDASSPSSPDSSLVYQLQVLFAHLQESEQKSVDTRTFCLNYRPDGREPVNPSIQMDADEFLRTLFDKLENELKVIKKDDMLKRYFYGTLIDQIISRDCEHRRERPEPSSSVSISVLGKKSLQQALESFVDGDMLEGDNQYHCSQCDKKVDALKRTCLGELSDYLIIHLKRFEFDLELLRRIKVNDEFRFPHELNVKDFTREGLAAHDELATDGSSSEIEVAAEGKRSPAQQRPPAYYEYRLRGILVHSGTAEAGHYYSFIRAKPRDEAVADGEWFEFNDAEVVELDSEKLEASTFGGIEAVQDYDAHLMSFAWKNRPKRYNAYMLIYERPEKLESGSLSLGDSLRSLGVSNDIYTKIWESNTNFYREKALYSTNCFDFIWKFATLGFAQSAVFTSSVQLAVRTMFLVLAHSKSGRKLLPSLVSEISEQMEVQSARQSNSWLANAVLDIVAEEAHAWLRAVLFGCPHQETREVLCGLISSAMANGAPAQRALYVSSADADIMDVETVTPNSLFPSIRSRSATIRIMQASLSMLPDARSHWRIFSEYWLLWKNFVNLGKEEQQWCRHHDIWSQLADVFLGEVSPLWLQREESLRAAGKSDSDISAERPKRVGDQYTEAEFENLVAFLIDAMEDRIASGSPEFTNDEARLLMSREFYVAILADSSKKADSVVRLILGVLHSRSSDSDFFLLVVDVACSFLRVSKTADAGQAFFALTTELLKDCSCPPDASPAQVQRMEERVVHIISTYVQRINELVGIAPVDILQKSMQLLVNFARASAASDAPHHSRFSLPRSVFTILDSWLMANLDLWMRRWMVEHSIDSLRSTALCLAVALIPGMPLCPVSAEPAFVHSLRLGVLAPTYDDAYSRISQEGWERARDIVHYLVSFLRLIEPQGAARLWTPPVTQHQLDPVDIRLCRPYHMLHVLRWFTPTFTQRRWLLESDGLLLQLSIILKQADESPYRQKNDWSKGALMDLFYHLSFEDNAQFVMPESAGVASDAAMALAISQAGSEGMPDPDDSDDQIPQVVRVEGKEDDTLWLTADPTKQQHTEVLSFLCGSSAAVNGPGTLMLVFGAFVGHDDKTIEYNNRHTYRYYRLLHRMCWFSNSTLNPALGASWEDGAEAYHANCFAASWAAAAGDQRLANFKWALEQFVMATDTRRPRTVDNPTIAQALISTYGLLRDSGFGGHSIGQTVVDKLDKHYVESELPLEALQLLARAMHRTRGDDEEDDSWDPTTVEEFPALDEFGSYIRDADAPTKAVVPSFCMDRKGPERISQMLEARQTEAESAGNIMPPEVASYISEALRVLLIGVSWLGMSVGHSAAVLMQYVQDQQTLRPRLPRAGAIREIGSNEEDSADTEPDDVEADTDFDPSSIDKARLKVLQDWPSHASLLFACQSLLLCQQDPVLTARIYVLLAVLSRFSDVCRESCVEMLRSTSRELAVEAGSFSDATIKDFRGAGRVDGAKYTFVIRIARIAVENATVPSPEALKEVSDAADAMLVILTSLLNLEECPLSSAARIATLANASEVDVRDLQKLQHHVLRQAVTVFLECAGQNSSFVAAVRSKASLLRAVAQAAGDVLAEEAAAYLPQGSITDLLRFISSLTGVA